MKAKGGVVLVPKLSYEWTSVNLYVFRSRVSLKGRCFGVCPAIEIAAAGLGNNVVGWARARQLWVPDMAWNDHS
jgi:hypothetical protein